VSIQTHNPLAFGSPDSGVHPGWDHPLGIIHHPQDQVGVRNLVVCYRLACTVSRDPIGDDYLELGVREGLIVKRIQ
jgi:hypothetical protein